MSRLTIQQLEALVEFLEQNPGIAKGQLRTIQAKQETKRRWAFLATTLNAMGGANKDGAGWAKYWAEKKCALRKHCSAHAASMMCTDGGLDNLPSLSPLDLRLVEVLGGRSFVVRDSEPAVESFYQSTSQMGTLAPAPSGDTEELHTQPPFTLETIVARSTTPQPQPLSITTQPDPLQSPRRRRLLRSQRHLRRVRQSSISQQIDKLVRLEQRRVAAETVTAQAYADATVKIDRCAAALEQLSEAVREGATTIANALLEIARRTPHT